MDPLTIIGLLLGGGSFLSSLFGGGGDEQTQTTTSETDSQKYRSPLLGAMEPSIISALLGNAQSLGGAGMPGGVSRFGSNANTMFSDVISLLSKEWPTIMGEYNNPTNENQSTGVCKEKCKSFLGTNQYKDCFSKCRLGQ
jgi:hypothetical protein